MPARITGTAAWSLCLVALLGCGDSAGPTDVTLGETTLLFIVNPTINTDTDVQGVPTPGTVRQNVNVSVQGGPSGTTDAEGVVVLSPIEPGTKTVTFSGGGLSGSISLSIAEKDLREVAVALTSSGAQIMANVLYAFGGTVVEVTPSMTEAEVNDELAKSDLIVLFKSGTYSGNLTFSGSSVTLFGEGARGGTVTLNGTIEVGGSNNRIRGTRITSGFSVPGSGFGFSFSRVGGGFTLGGSGATLLNNAFCGSVTISGSGLRALGNAGMDPVPQPSGGC